MIQSAKRLGSKARISGEEVLDVHVVMHVKLEVVDLGDCFNHLHPGTDICVHG